MAEEFAVRTVADLEAVVGEAHPFVRNKIFKNLDDLMIEFIGRSPLVMVATRDADGGIDVSPKGDPAGFVQVEGSKSLIIPERPGNQLTLGFRNILDNGQIGLIFMVPKQRETLRIKGRATLHRDPDVLESMTVNRKPALLYTRVAIEECFIHCGKAMIRSHVWQPDAWDEGDRSIGGQQLASVVGAKTDEEIAASAKRLEGLYQNDLY